MQSLDQKEIKMTFTAWYKTINGAEGDPSFYEIIHSYSQEIVQRSQAMAEIDLKELCHDIQSNLYITKVDWRRIFGSRRQ